MNGQSHWSNDFSIHSMRQRKSFCYPVVTDCCHGRSVESGGDGGGGGSGGGFITIQHHNFPSVHTPRVGPGQVVQDHPISPSAFIPFARNAQFSNMPFEPTEEEYATLQKLSSEYAPEMEVNHQQVLH